MTGTHGTGKTTAVNALADMLKTEYSHLKIVKLPEVARACPWPINQNTSPEGQHQIFHAQLAAELAAGRDADILICDRSGLDSLIYAMRAEAKSESLENWDFVAYAATYFMDVWFRSYDLLWWFRPGFPLVADGVRDIDPQFQKDIDDIFKDMITDLNLEDYFPTWPGIEAAFNEAKHLINAKSGQ